ncbi:hypothetical protein AB7Y23_22360, partial [Escherichia coli]
SLKTSIKTITYLSDIGCLEIQGASLDGKIIHLAHCEKSGVTKTWFYRISKSKYCFENRCIKS